MKSCQHPGGVSQYSRHDCEADRDWHLHGGLQCTAQGSDLCFHHALDDDQR